MIFVSFRFFTSVRHRERIDQQLGLTKKTPGYFAKRSARLEAKVTEANLNDGCWSSISSTLQSSTA